MRCACWLASLLLLLVLRPGSAAAEEESDDPKSRDPRVASSGSLPPSSVFVMVYAFSVEEVLVDEDDPKLARIGRLGPSGADSPPPTPVVEHAAPFAKLAYRYLTARSIEGPDLQFNVIQLDLLPISQRWVRAGLDIEVGLGPGQYSLYYLATGVSLGFQYPWRVTPFVDVRFIAGLVYGDAAGRSFLSYTWMPGIDFGFELYLVGRLYLSVAIGWAHPVYRGIDATYQRTHPLADPRWKDIESDTFTFKVGLGL
jgi:hypothetical protein